MPIPSVAVIGAGFSGTLLSLQLLRKAPPGTRVMLIERNQPFGPGLAYGTGNPHHLLNVPVGRMSAFNDQPRDFLDWLKLQSAQMLDGVEPHEAAFVPRRLYGAYLRHQLNVAALTPSLNTLELVHDNVVAIERNKNSLTLRYQSGHVASVDHAVLATGNNPPEAIPVRDPAFYRSARWRPNPWAPDAFTNLDQHDPVLLIGSGLTMVDTVIALLDRGHVGPIHAMSRRGLLPRRHAVPGPHAAPSPGGAFTADVRVLTKKLRRQCAEATAAGQPWQTAFEALRPITQDIWQALSVENRKRFLRHLRPWWDVHRHRMPAAVVDRIEAAQASGQLVIRAGRIYGYQPTDGAVYVQYRPRRSATVDTLRVARVINCSGAGSNVERATQPLIRALLRDGMIRPDALRLGVDVTDAGAVRCRTGNASQRLFAIGPLTKGAFWEITSVPDIRKQCEALAVNLARLLREPARKPAKVMSYAN